MIPNHVWGWDQSWVDICDIPYLSIWVNLITTSLFSRTGIMVYFREIIPFYGLTIQGSEIFYPDLCDIPSYMWDDPHGMGDYDPPISVLVLAVIARQSHLCTWLKATRTRSIYQSHRVRICHMFTCIVELPFFKALLGQVTPKLCGGRKAKGSHLVQEGD